MNREQKLEKALKRALEYPLLTIMRRADVHMMRAAVYGEKVARELRDRDIQRGRS